MKKVCHGCSSLIPPLQLGQGYTHSHSQTQTHTHISLLRCIPGSCVCCTGSVIACSNVCMYVYVCVCVCVFMCVGQILRDLISLLGCFIFLTGRSGPHLFLCVKGKITMAKKKEIVERGRFSSYLCPVSPPPVLQSCCRRHPGSSSSPCVTRRRIWVIVRVLLPPLCILSLPPCSSSVSSASILSSSMSFPCLSLSNLGANNIRNTIASLFVLCSVNLRFSSFSVFPLGFFLVQH